MATSWLLARRRPISKALVFQLIQVRVTARSDTRVNTIAKSVDGERNYRQAGRHRYRLDGASGFGVAHVDEVRAIGQIDVIQHRIDGNGVRRVREHDVRYNVL